MKEIFWFIVIFIAIGTLWFFAGGPKMQSSKSGIWLAPPSSPKTVPDGASIYQNQSVENNLGSSSASD